MIMTNGIKKAVEEVKVNGVYAISELFDFDGKTDCVEDILDSGAIAMFDEELEEEVVVNFIINYYNDVVEDTDVIVKSIG